MCMSNARIVKWQFIFEKEKEIKRKKWKEKRNKKKNGERKKQRNVADIGRLCGSERRLKMLTWCGCGGDDRDKKVEGDR